MGPLVVERMLVNDMHSTSPQPMRTPPAGAEANWETHAACRSVENAADLFFSEDIGEISAAKRICAACPVLAPCLEGAMRRAEPCGVWGGQLFMNGKMLAVKRRRGRPPKVARPEDQMPVVDVPAHLLIEAERRTA
jgi:WhiB family redox-sensing transcriptional regulator